MNNLSPEKQNVFGWGINERLSNGDIQISPLSNPRMTIAFVASNASHGEACRLWPSKAAKIANVIG